MFVNGLLSIFLLIFLSERNCAETVFPFIRASAPLYTKNVTPLKEGLSYKTLYYEQQVNHFGFAKRDTYKQRYLFADQFWKKNEGPIFFFTGGEGDIEWYCHNMGFLWDIAPKFNAMLVFAEHRYYGKSLIYGPDPFKNLTGLNYLTSEQALVDYAKLTQHIKHTLPGAANSSVVAFGSAYSGMLAAWFRMKYPNIVIGSLASSAPVWQFNGITPCNVFYTKTTNAWRQVSPTCVDNIFRSWDDIAAIANEHFGLRYISRVFGLCQPLRSSDDYWQFAYFLRDIYVALTEANYPYPANYVADLPGWPVKRACSSLSTPLRGRALANAVAQVAKLFFNDKGTQKCVDWVHPIRKDIGYQGWNYQSCTELVMPTCAGGPDMFFVIPWNFKEFTRFCQNLYKVTPREDWITSEYWGTELNAASNIIFSNGLMDPWSGGGVLQSISDTVVAIQMPQGAQSVDLRFKNEKDTPDVIKAREQEFSIIREWVEKHRAS